MKGQVKLEPQPSQPNPEIVVVTTFFSSARFFMAFPEPSVMDYP